MIKSILIVCIAFVNLNFQNRILSQSLPEMVYVKGGSFKMGNNSGESDEKPTHTVILSDFYIAKYEVTVAQYKAYCNEVGRRLPNDPKPSWYEEHPNASKWVWNNNYPILNVSWNDAIEYCKWLSRKTGQNYTLPTEAQWEYAARGGQYSKNYKYSGSNNINKVAWYDETTYEKGPQPVGSLKPNELGIYDMSGNAWEWCKDFFGKYSSSTQTDPSGPSNSPFRVIRGGSWYYVAHLARLTARDGPYPHYTNYNYGFRVARIP
ncbi:MAG: formylglycine-generating enzyme family protein [Bacteroidales bacterium]|nr:formylglycine-generating enzyme family protein [Bacteroidales bacterium]